MGSDWTTDNIEAGENMFSGCESLIGDAGTAYNENHVDYTYARIDLGATNRGYLSDNSPGNKPYAVPSEDSPVLTFYYDDQKAARGGRGVGPFYEDDESTYGGYHTTWGPGIESVVFDESFANCTTITSTRAWFYGCNDLTTITGLENLKTDNVTDMCGMFYECGALTSLDVSGFNTQNVTGMSYMFYLCSGLTSLDLSGFNTSKVIDMGGMFHGCSGLTSLDVSGFNTSNVTMMANMFGGCSGLTSLDVSGFDTSKATNMAFMFSYCPGLTSLDLSGFNTANVTLMTHMFMDCTSLNTIYVGEGWSTENIMLESDGVGGVGIFSHCTALVGGAGTTYDENHVDQAYAHLDEGATVVKPYAVFSDNNTVLTFYYDDQKVSRGGMDVVPFNNENQRSWNLQSFSIERVVFDESFANCTTITSTSYWFYNCSQLTTITGWENLKTDNVTDMSYMFRNCRALTSLDLSGFDTSNVTDMSEMFASCSGLTSLDVNGFNTQNVTNMSGMFAGCKSLTNLDVSGFDTSNVTDMSDMFAELKGEQISLDLSGFNTSNVTNMEEMFVESMSLTGINLSSFNTFNVTNMEDMFAECEALTSLDISSFNTSNVTNMRAMFRGCPELTTIYAGEGWSTENISSEEDGADMFDECTALVGGAGTTYDENHIDYTYAHIDTEGYPGYFTASSSGEEPNWQELNYMLEYGADVLSRAKESGNVDQWMLEELEMFLNQGHEMYKEHTASAEEVRAMTEDLEWRIREVEEAMKGGGDGGEAEPYAVLSEDNTMLTFYYDNEKEARGGMDVGPFTESSQRGWDDYDNNIQSVVFDESFANCTTITSTSWWFYGFKNLTTIKDLDIQYLQRDRHGSDVP